MPPSNFSPGRRGVDSTKNMGPPLGWFESHFRTAELDLDALNTADLGARDNLKTRGGSLSSEGANATAQAERSTPIKVLRSLEYNHSLILNAITTLNLSSDFIFMVNAIPA
jgi:hypothetical protein